MENSHPLREVRVVRVVRGPVMAVLWRFLVRSATSLQKNIVP